MADPAVQVQAAKHALDDFVLSVIAVAIVAVVVSSRSTARLIESVGEMLGGLTSLVVRG